MILNKYYGRKSAGETASIKVYAPSNRLVSATKGEKVREGVYDTDHFLISNIDEYGDWDVSIETPRLYLYKDGDECVDVTGGWFNNTSATYGSMVSNNATYQPTKNPTDLAFNTYYINGNTMQCTNKIDLTNYNKIFILGKSTGNTEATAMPILSLSDNANTLVDSGQTSYSGTNVEKVNEFDISAVTGEKYVSLFAYSGRVGNVYKVWLE